MKLSTFRRLPQALAIAGMVSSMGAVSAWGSAGDNGQYFMIEGLYLSQDDGDTIPFTQDIGGITPFKLVTSDDVSFEDTGGARATIQFDAFGHKWQASAFGVVPFDQDFSVSNLDPSVGSTSTTYAEFVGGTTPQNSDEFDAIFLHQEGQLWGAEFSWVKNLGGYGLNSVDLLVGVRYIHYGEELTSVVFDEPGTSAFVDDAFIDVDNDLLGLQIGLQGMWKVASNVSIGGSLKGGVAANFVNRDRSFASNGSQLYADGRDDTDLAEFAEFNPRVEVELSDTATLTIGGTVLWINETSSAATQYQTVAAPLDANLRNDDDQLFYGASIGLKLALN